MHPLHPFAMRHVNEIQVSPVSTSSWASSNTWLLYGIETEGKYTASLRCACARLVTVGNLRSSDDDGSENDTQRTNLLCLYPNSFNLFNMAELSGAELKEQRSSLDRERKFTGIVLTFFKKL